MSPIGAAVPAETSEIRCQPNSGQTQGTTAIISVYPENIVDAMRSSGWRRPNDKDKRTWRVGDATVKIFSPEQARGLEFDAVVIVEPAHYSNDQGRHGQLYTSLTRANRELTVIHHKRLPAGLKNPK